MKPYTMDLLRKGVLVCGSCDGFGTVLELRDEYSSLGYLSDEVTCPHCKGAGLRTQPPALAEWSDAYEFYRNDGYDDLESTALADRDMDTIREETVYY